MLAYSLFFYHTPASIKHPSELLCEPSWLVSLNNSVRLPKQWIIDVYFEYRDARNNAYLLLGSISSPNSSVKKTFFENTQQVSLKLTDIINTSKARKSSGYHGIMTNNYVWYAPRNYHLDIVWHFNKHHLRKKRLSISNEIQKKYNSWRITV